MKQKGLESSGKWSENERGHATKVRRCKAQSPVGHKSMHRSFLSSFPSPQPTEQRQKRKMPRGKDKGKEKGKKGKEGVGMGEGGKVSGLLSQTGNVH